MKVTKVQKGDYIITDNTSVYEVYQSSVSKKWFLYKGVRRARSEFLTAKKTMAECKKFIQLGYTEGDYTEIQNIPSQHIDQKYKSKRTGNIWSVDDIIYSTSKGKWIIKASYYNDSIDEGWNYFDCDEWEDCFDELTQ